LFVGCKNCPFGDGEINISLTCGFIRETRRSAYEKNAFGKETIAEFVVERFAVFTFTFDNNSKVDRIALKPWLPRLKAADAYAGDEALKKVDATFTEGDDGAPVEPPLLSPRSCE